MGSEGEHGPGGWGLGPQEHPQGWHPSPPHLCPVGLDHGAAFLEGSQADIPPGAGLSEGLAAPRFPQRPAPPCLHPGGPVFSGVKRAGTSAKPREAEDQGSPTSGRCRRLT